MDLKELLKSEANISITVSLYDLRQLFREIAGEIKASA